MWSFAFILSWLILHYLPLAVILLWPDTTFPTRREIHLQWLCSWGLHLPLTYKCTLKGEQSTVQGGTSWGPIWSGPSRELRSVSQAGVSSLCLEKEGLPLTAHEHAGEESSCWVGKLSAGHCLSTPLACSIDGHCSWKRETKWTVVGGGEMNVKWVSKEFINSVRCKTVMNREVMKME